MGVAVRLDKWTDERSKSVMVKRLRESQADKESKGLPEQWKKNLRAAYTASPVVEHQPSSNNQPGMGGINNNPIRASMGINLVQKNLRLLHSQLSANPPTCIPRPTTSDQNDRRAARAADRVIRHSLRAYGLQEKVDQVTLSTLARGIGILKVWWDPARGDIMRVGKDGQSLLLEGDMGFEVIDPDLFFPDPRAKSEDKVLYVIEGVDMTREDFLVRFPKFRHCLKKKVAQGTYSSPIEEMDPSSVINGRMGTSFADAPTGDGHDEVEVIRVYEYWETGHASNGYAGRFAVFLGDGTLLIRPRNSPQAFRPRPTLTDIKRRRKGEKPILKPRKARLPYMWLTDIDVPETIWGKAFIEFAEPLQDLSNRISSTILANIQAHSVMRLLVEDGGAEVTNSSWSNDPFVVVKYKRKSSGSEPKFMQPGQLPTSTNDHLAYVERGIGDAAGTNEANFGQASRETSGYQMSYAVNQANLIRRRLFNKYVLFVEKMYQTILDLAIKHWSTARTIEVLGKEKSFELIDLRGSDIQGGYSLVVEYGTSLSLDPMTRRDEILRLQPLLEKAGISPRTILSMLKLGELDSLSDAAGMAEDRMREIIEKIAASEIQILPQFGEDHAGMLAYALMYVMTKEFKELDPVAQDLVRQHLRLRAKAGREDAAVLGGQTAGADAEVSAVGGAAAMEANAGAAAEAVPEGAISAGPGAMAGAA